MNRPEPGSLVVRALCKRFGSVEVLREISLAMQGGESLAITGPSGSGKSTLLHLVGTLDVPSSGDVIIDGRNPFALPEPELARFRNQTVGFVFQNHLLLPHYSVLENVLLPTLAFGKADQQAEQRALALLDRVGLSHRLHHRPAMLSGGECQRAALARGLIQRPSLLLCDEPTGNLDHATASAVAALLFELHRAEGAILIIATHHLELAAQCQRHCQLREGRWAAG